MLGKLAVHYEFSELELQRYGEPPCILRLPRFIKISQPDFVFLSETLVEAKVIKELAEKCDFCDSFAVDRVGRGGGMYGRYVETYRGM